MQVGFEEFLKTQDAWHSMPPPSSSLMSVRLCSSVHDSDLVITS